MRQGNEQWTDYSSMCPKCSAHVDKYKRVCEKCGCVIRKFNGKVVK